MAVINPADAQDVEDYTRKLAAQINRNPTAAGMSLFYRKKPTSNLPLRKKPRLVKPGYQNRDVQGTFFIEREATGVVLYKAGSVEDVRAFAEDEMEMEWVRSTNYSEGPARGYYINEYGQRFVIRESSPPPRQPDQTDWNDVLSGDAPPPGRSGEDSRTFKNMPDTPGENQDRIRAVKAHTGKTAYPEKFDAIVKAHESLDEATKAMPGFKTVSGKVFVHELSDWPDDPQERTLSDGALTYYYTYDHSGYGERVAAYTIGKPGADTSEHYIFSRFLEEEAGDGDQPANGKLAKQLAASALRNKSAISLQFRQLWRHKYVKGNYDASQAWKLFYWPLTHAGAGGKGYNPATRRAASKIMVSAFNKWARGSMKAKVKRADGMKELPVGQISRSEFIKWFGGGGSTTTEAVDEALTIKKKSSTFKGWYLSVSTDSAQEASAVESALREFPHRFPLIERSGNTVRVLAASTRTIRNAKDAKYNLRTLLPGTSLDIVIESLDEAYKVGDETPIGKIVGKHASGKFMVQAPGSKFSQLLSADDIDVDIKRVKANKAFRAKQAAAKSEKETTAAKRDDTHGFLDGIFSKPLRGRASKYLLQRTIRWRGKFYRHKEFVEALYTAGHTPATNKHKLKYLAVGKDGSFLKLDKTAFDYLTHLRKVKVKLSESLDEVEYYIVADPGRSEFVKAFQKAGTVMHFTKNSEEAAKTKHRSDAMLWARVARDVYKRKRFKSQYVIESLDEVRKKPMTTPREVALRNKDFDTATCDVCRYYKKGFCQVLNQDVEAKQVCDAYQGDEKKFKAYKVKDADMQAFFRGMVKNQPYQHVVVRGINTPVGPLLIIRDTMKPKPHIFSLNVGFHKTHTAREHAWTQAEVNKLVKAGGTTESLAASFVTADDTSPAMLATFKREEDAWRKKMLKFPAKPVKGMKFFVHWADGRGLVSFTSKAAMLAWFDTMTKKEVGIAEIVKVWHGTEDKKKVLQRESLDEADYYSMSRRAAERRGESGEQFARHAKHALKRVPPDELRSLYNLKSESYHIGFDAWVHRHFRQIPESMNEGINWSKRLPVSVGDTVTATKAFEGVPKGSKGRVTTVKADSFTIRWENGERTTHKSTAGLKHVGFTREKRYLTGAGIFHRGRRRRARKPKPKNVNGTGTGTGGGTGTGTGGGGGAGAGTGTGGGTGGANGSGGGNGGQTEAEIDVPMAAAKNTRLRTSNIADKKLGMTCAQCVYWDNATTKCSALGIKVKAEQLCDLYARYIEKMTSARMKKLVGYFDTPVGKLAVVGDPQKRYSTVVKEDPDERRDLATLAAVQRTGASSARYTGARLKATKKKKKGVNIGPKTSPADSRRTPTEFYRLGRIEPTMAELDEVFNTRVKNWKPPEDEASRIAYNLNVLMTKNAEFERRAKKEEPRVLPEIRRMQKLVGVVRDAMAKKNKDRAKGALVELREALAKFVAKLRKLGHEVIESVDTVSTMAEGFVDEAKKKVRITLLGQNVQTKRGSVRVGWPNGTITHYSLDGENYQIVKALAKHNPGKAANLAKKKGKVNEIFLAHGGPQSGIVPPGHTFGRERTTPIVFPGSELPMGKRKKKKKPRFAANFQTDIYNEAKVRKFTRADAAKSDWLAMEFDAQERAKKKSKKESAMSMGDLFVEIKHPKQTSDAKNAEKHDFDIDDVQLYYDMQIAGSANKHDATKRTKRQFKLKTLEVNPTGRIAVQGLERPTPPRLAPQAAAGGGAEPPPEEPAPPEGGATKPPTPPSPAKPAPKAQAATEADLSPRQSDNPRADAGMQGSGQGGNAITPTGPQLWVARCPLCRSQAPPLIVKPDRGEPCINCASFIPPRLYKRVTGTAGVRTT